MHARRRARPAAIAAVLLGAGLLLYRPARMPELRAGSRAAPPTSPAVRAAMGAGPTVPGRDPQTGSDDVDTLARAAEEADALRDAPSDRGFASGGHSPSSSQMPSAGGALLDRASDKTPFTAKPSDSRPSTARAFFAASRRRGRDPDTPQPDNLPARTAQDIPRRAPLAQGPAVSADDNAEDGDRTVDPRQGATGPNTSTWTRRQTRPFPLFHPPRRAAGFPKRAAFPRRVRPLLLSKLLGPGALRPPPSSITPPDLSSLKGRKPLLLPDGSPVPVRPYELDRIEAQDPRRTATATDRRIPAHWDAGHLWHDGAARGLIAGARWLWLWKEKTRWWAVSEPEEAPLLRHRELWWSKQRGVWFALHDGELWSWRRFADWDAEGLIRLADGVELVYSADFTKVAVITPGAGAVLYDAATGAELGRWLESELPHRRPRAPIELRLPRGI